jgi:hypothetical protein
MKYAAPLTDGVGTTGMREILEGQDKADGGDHSNEARLTRQGESGNPAQYFSC